jgi:mutator protein MutT
MGQVLGVGFQVLETMAMSEETIVVGIGLIWDGDKLVVGIRQPGKALAGRHEFPGGKCHDGESPALATIRECHEETGLTVELIGLRLRTLHRYLHGHINLHFFDCRASNETPLNPPFEWRSVRELGSLHFPDGNAELLADLARRPFPLAQKGERGT